ncbi:hypothetical protein LAZ67_18002090 [Cordylochernes scorpioides]|uniref:Transposase n=1 Tax=Cordylochernes scorpioides TaxID=51811 RepID=A0ABY6LH88_9ARAC|nr:hypothetical protein LAZ67_18002090 [Cordylochernes scorpioides]
MERSLEQRYAIKFCAFKEGGEEVADEPRSGRPTTARTDENVDRVLEVLRTGRRLSIQQITDTLHMSTFVVHVIVTEDLQMRKVCAKLVPKVLTQDQKELRVLRCQELLDLIKNEPDFLNSVVTGDESWMFEYDPESKRQSCAWHTKSSPRPKKARMSKSRIKTMIIVFFDIRGIVHCAQEIKRRIARVRTDIKDTVKLHHDNATSHTAFIITNFLARSNTSGTLCLSKSNVFIWHKRFSDGRNTLEDDKHTGRSSFSKTPESIEKVREFFANNRSASLRMMAEVLHINKETIRTILHEDLGKTKVYAKFVPHTLTGEQKSLRIAHCRDIISAYENDSNFLKSIVTGDETWCFQYDPKTKCQSAEWKSKNSPQAKKTRKVPSKIKTMLITFFDSRGIIHKEFVTAGQTITGEYYLNVLKRLIARIRRIRPEYRDEDSWCLLHDNAPSHSSLIVRRFLAKNNVCVLNQPPYSPDLAPCDFYLFPKIKLKLKGFFFFL